MFDAISKNVTENMDKALAVLRDEMAKLRTGRASVAILDGVRVEYYGSQLPINQMASVSVPDPRLIVIQPWDQSALPAIEKAIQKSELGLSPQNDGKTIKLPVPPLTEERRKDLVKVVHKFAEESRVAIRNVRRHGLEELKKQEKQFSEDDVKRFQTQIQTMTDGHIKKVDAMVDAKSKEILEL